MLLWILTFQLFLLALLCAVFVLVAWTFHKTRKIHVTTNQMLPIVKTTSAECLSLFPQLHALFELNKLLDSRAPLPSMRGWAGSPDFLLTVADALVTRQAGCVVECSSGVSTIIIARCLQLNGYGHVFSLEHDPKYAERTVTMLHRHGLEEFASVLYAPLKYHQDGTLWYDDSVLPAELDPIEILVIDGPPKDIAPRARFPALPRLLPRLADNALIILDDADRPDEREIVEQWQQIEPTLSVSHLPHEKGCAIIERSSSTDDKRR